MKLLLDENLSPKLVAKIAAQFPDSSQVDLHDLRGSSDAKIWEFARNEGFTIVSKDNDFRQRTFLHGSPPKVIWLSVGNAGTEEIANLLIKHRQRIIQFCQQSDEGLLVLQM